MSELRRSNRDVTEAMIERAAVVLNAYRDGMEMDEDLAETVLRAALGMTTPECEDGRHAQCAADGDRPCGCVCHEGVDGRTESDSAEVSHGPFDPDALVRWAESYGDPEWWCKRAQDLYCENERLRSDLALRDDSLANRRVRDLRGENERLRGELELVRRHHGEAITALDRLLREHVQTPEAATIIHEALS